MGAEQSQINSRCRIGCTEGIGAELGFKVLGGFGDLKGRRNPNGKESVLFFYII